MSKIAVDDYWYQWCLEEIDIWSQEEQGTVDDQLLNLETDLNSCREKLERLLDIHIDGGIDSDEYKAKKNKLVSESSNIEGKINEIKDKGDDWRELLTTTLKVSNEAHHSILKKDFKQMGKILKKVGANPVLMNKKYSVDFLKPFCFYREAVSGIAKHNSPKTTTIKKIDESQIRSGASDFCGGEAVAKIAPTRTLSSAHTVGKPRQSHCTAEAAEGIAELCVKWRTERDSNPR